MRDKLTPTSIWVLIVSVLSVITLITLGTSAYRSYSKQEGAQEVAQDSLSGRVLELYMGDDKLDISTSLLHGSYQATQLYSDQEVPVRVEVKGNPFPHSAHLHVGDKELDRQGETYTTTITLPRLTKQGTVDLSVKNGKDTRMYQIKQLPDDFPEVEFKDMSTDKSHSYRNDFGGKHFYTNYYSKTAEEGGEMANYIVKYDVEGNVQYYRRNANREIVNFNAWHNGDENGYYYFQEEKSNNINHYSYTRGKYVVMDDHYRIVDEVRPLITDKYHPPRAMAEMHDFVYLGKNHYMVMDYDPIMDEKQGRISATYLQEIKDGQVVWEWLSSEHEELDVAKHRDENNSNQVTYTNDYLHSNSIDLSDPSSVIVSIRNINTVIKIDRATGGIKWLLGGKQNQFEVTGESLFKLQHHATMVDDHTMAVFDNGGGEGNERTRGMLIDLDEQGKKAHITHVYPEHGTSKFTGSMQKIGDNYFIGWGSSRTNPTIASLVNIDGEHLFDVKPVTEGLNPYRFVLN